MTVPDDARPIAGDGIRRPAARSAGTADAAHGMGAWSQRVTLALLVLAAGVSAALGATPPTHQACNVLIREKAYLEAARCTDSVYAHAPEPIGLYRAGQLYASAGEVEVAVERYQAYIASGDAAFVDEVRRSLAALYAQAYGRVRADCDRPSARVRVDGHDIGACAATSDLIRAGVHRAQVLEGERVIAEAQVEVIPGRTVPCCALPAADASRGWVPWTLAGVGLAGVLAGVVVNVVYDREWQQYAEGTAPHASPLATYEDRFHDLQAGAMAGYITGGVLLATGAAWLIWQAVADDEAGAARVIWQGPGVLVTW